MKDTSLEKASRFTIREKGQYVLAFGVVGVMLYLVGFPVFILFFFGVLSFFIWKAFTSGSRNDTKQIFEFYLSASDIIADSDRRWFGFEVQEATAKGELIVREMAAAPPLVHFTLGALYQKAGDHSSAVKHLNQVVGESAMTESAVVFPTRELREYVRILRKIEREPSESPLTWAAVTTLERLRTERAGEMLEFSKRAADGQQPDRLTLNEIPSVTDNTDFDSESTDHASSSVLDFTEVVKVRKERVDSDVHSPHERRTISEVLHDIYDEKVQ